MIKKLVCFALITLALAAPTIAQKSQTIERERFSLKYPGNWTIDKEDEDYDPDALFSIDAPDDNGMIMFIIVDGKKLDLEELLTNQETAIKEKLIETPTSISSFTKWGNYTGQGKTIKGKFMGIAEGEVNIFVSHVGDGTFYVMEQLIGKEIEETRKGLLTVSTSFKFKRAP